MVKSSAGCLVRLVVAMLAAQQMVQLTLLTQTRQLQPVVFNPPQSRKLMYSKPTEPIFIPESLRSRDVASSTYQMLPLPEIHSVVDEFLRGMNKDFIELSRLLYKSALEKNRILLTLQIGGMDGVSNDPMHKIFVYQDSSKHFNLSSWFPVVVEPVPTNFDQLKKNYALIQARGGLPGTAISQFAVTAERDQKTCEFCHWKDTSKHERCVNTHDWVRLQLGTLDCAHLEELVGIESSILCIVRDPIPCGTVYELFSRLGFQMKESEGIKVPIGILQMDVEGYEVFILQSLMNEILDEDYLPLVIHFEKKVMLDQDRRNLPGRKVNGTKIGRTFNLLRRRGYVIFDEGGDALALRSAAYV